MKIQIKKLSENAKIPTQATKGDAGYDLYAAEPVTLEPMQRALIKTDISVAIPQGYYGRVAPRSGLAYKAGLDVLAGVVDASYRNSVGVILINLGDKVERISQGDRCAQLIIEKCHDVEWEEVPELDVTDRNLGGFGSSGK